MQNRSYEKEKGLPRFNLKGNIVQFILYVQRILDEDMYIKFTRFTSLFVNDVLKN